MKRGCRLCMTLMFSHIFKSPLLSSQLQLLLRSSRWLSWRHRGLGCWFLHPLLTQTLSSSVLCSVFPLTCVCQCSVSLIFIVSLIHLAFLFFNFEHFLASHLYPPTCIFLSIFLSPLYSTYHFIFYSLSLVIILLSLFGYLFPSPQSILWTHFKTNVSIRIKTKIWCRNILPRNPNSPFTFWHCVPRCYSPGVYLTCSFTAG